MEAVELSIGLNDSSRVSATVAERNIAHDGDDSMFLDIEMVIWIETPDPKSTQVDAIDWKYLGKEHSARIGDKLGDQRNDVNRGIT